MNATAATVCERVECPCHRVHTYVFRSVNHRRVCVSEVQPGMFIQRGHGLSAYSVRRVTTRDGLVSLFGPAGIGNTYAPYDTVLVLELP